MLAMGDEFIEPAMLMFAGVGAALAGLSVAGLFGGRGEDGIFAAVAGAVMATGLGTLLGGVALALSTGFGGAVVVAPVAVAESILREPGWCRQGRAAWRACNCGPCSRGVRRRSSRYSRK